MPIVLVLLTQKNYPECPVLNHRGVIRKWSHCHQYPLPLPLKLAMRWIRTKDREGHIILSLCFQIFQLIDVIIIKLLSGVAQILCNYQNVLVSWYYANRVLFLCWQKLSDLWVYRHVYWYQINWINLIQSKLYKWVVCIW